MSSNTDLSAREQEILNLLRQGLIENGYPPTVREICALTGLRSTATVHAYLERLEKKGYIKKAEDKPRAISIVNNDENYADAVEAVLVPLVGEVAAGNPILATENIEATIPLPKDMVRDSECFLLRIRGESMVEAGILPGDLVVVRRKNSADNGDIVVAMLQNDATVKRFFKEKNKIRLQPENSTMDPIYSTEVNILGKVIGLLRTVI